MKLEDCIGMSSLTGSVSSLQTPYTVPRPSKITRIKSWLQSKVNFLRIKTLQKKLENLLTLCYLSLIFYEDINFLLKITNATDLDKTVNVVDHNTARARDSIQQAVGLIVKMDENLKEQEEVLQQRASNLRRQSADAFKLMEDVNRLHQYV